MKRTIFYSLMALYAVLMFGCRVSAQAPNPPAIAEVKTCSCTGKLPCECGDNCRCVAVEQIQFVPCWGGTCAANASTPATSPQPMAGPGPATRVVATERTRYAQRTRGLVGRFFFPWRR